jgi:V/A-type H+-transporting ATPase subunit E
VEHLCSLPDAELIKLLTALAVEASATGKEALIFSVKDRARIGKQVVMAANEELAKRVSPELPGALTESRAGAVLGKVVTATAARMAGTAQLTLSEKTRPMRGGFIMADDEVEINCTFETLVRLQREKLEREVANVLFQ